MEQQKSIERVAIDKKLQTAANMRDENIKKMLERLKEHVSLILSIAKRQACPVTKTHWGAEQSIQVKKIYEIIFGRFRDFQFFFTFFVHFSHIYPILTLPIMKNILAWACQKVYHILQEIHFIFELFWFFPFFKYNIFTSAESDKIWYTTTFFTKTNKTKTIQTFHIHTTDWILGTE